ncbi:MAG: D-glycero-beta-D-manno-heptose-7-phosphate kinase [Candidatus Dactylopiibacterium carminicum]|uniref:D-glycero-beta-D-manno-heptose-7-phosphate kinase n=2 Tax=Candidatus Dactylopiibacterium carminicum TaxID=857335 RepID=A0A272ENS8_9RHOO|nr:D-glycero-beta-D-manno-heptose-7-phosphate kinase [Candidatus Dactylopiibacterium carminicum]PAS91686.1 MAG: D-glycero-beta-D-manno-heptose-7-phosphate kinase [Candidatus Dactylopiibacterium carminicum]PAS93681.1 MAG: D-glycero-beta-D-manno-heptose-7-phosphate kinase [Candidatus Dactylopiibacterium carminicum]
MSMSNPLPIIPETTLARVLVVGDVMLDRYWFGEVSRISPEAPVPVVHVQRSEERPGGAANVARNAAALGAKVSLLAVVGNDEPASALEQLLSDDGVNARLHRDPSLSTTIKLRVLGRQQQLLRIDFENLPAHEVLRDKLVEFRALLPEHDVVVLSDYGKGGLLHVQEMIDLARAAGKIVLVDPKGDDYSRYRGASLLTPNRSELRQVVGQWRNEEDLVARAQGLRSELALEALLVTRSEEGMSLFRAEGTVHEGTRAQEVFDVSGAGDTVIATLAVMLAAKSDLVDAMRLSNHAAGIVVAKLGTATVTLKEMQGS